MDQDVSEIDFPEKGEARSKKLATIKRRYSNYHDSDEESRVTVRFSPPAYIQRYQAVQKVLTDPRYGGKLKKIVDFGCSELGFFYYLKNIVGVEELLFVDIDRFTLESYKEKIRPLHVDYLHMRESPLLLQVLEGSVSDPDNILMNCDAVVCIELVEHLYPEPLTTFPYNIFGFIRPKVAVVTTPNADFNVLFKNMSKFRHPDHKFEWNRKQFQDWARNIVLRFPDYSVSFHGICNGPPGTEDLGACTQMAVFHKTQDLNIVKVPGVDGLFKTVMEHEYPYKVDNRSDEEKILDDAVYFIRKFSLNQDEITEEIPLQNLLNTMTNISANDLRKILENGNWIVVDREDGPAVQVPPISPFSSESLELDFSDHDYPAECNDWQNEPEESFDYVLPRHNLTVASENENWDSIPFAETEHRNTANTSSNTNVANSTPSIHADDVCLDDIATESLSLDLANSSVNESIFISSFSETKDSENSETPKDPCLQVQKSLIPTDSKITEASTSFFSTKSEESRFKNLENNSSAVSLCENSSICSMFLEPSKISKDLHIEDLSSHLESTITSPLVNEIFKSFRLSNNVSPINANENTFEKPKFTSSPHVSLPHNCEKEEIIKQNVKHLDSGCTSKCNEVLRSYSNNVSKDIFKLTDSKFSDPCTYSSKSTTVENSHSGYSPNKINSDHSEQTSTCTGAVSKNFSAKILSTSINAQRETKLEEISSDISESLPNSCSPEIMDSGYPNSNSLPDLSPEYDLSSIAHDHVSDSESSISDIPKYNFNELAEVENRDLANNNLDGEGNNVEVEEIHYNNDFQPLMNDLENDIENENDIYNVGNGFPIWLLRILQRFNADGVEINLPIP